MIYIQIDNINNIEKVHYMPFDENHGLNKSKEELELRGFFVDGLPVPETDNDRLDHILKYDGTNLYYDYVDKPLSDAVKLAALEKSQADQDEAIMILTLGGM